MRRVPPRRRVGPELPSAHRRGRPPGPLARRPAARASHALGVVADASTELLQLRRKRGERLLRALLDLVGGPIRIGELLLDGLPLIAKLDAGQVQVESDLVAEGPQLGEAGVE